MAETQPMIEEMEIEGSMQSADQAKEPSKSFLSIGFYQYYFNVSTATVLNRVRRVFLFRLNAAFSLLDLEPFPDMCGPVWIVMTVWLASVMCSDIGDRFLEPSIKQDFSRIGVCFGVVIANAVASLGGIFVATSGDRVVPVGFPSGSSQASSNAAHLLSLYGYSLAPFVPAVLLCIFPWSAARWVFLLLAAVFTSIFLAHDMWFIVHNKMRCIGVSVYLFLIQIAFCAALQFLVMGHEFPNSNVHYEPSVDANANITSTIRHLSIGSAVPTTAVNSTN